jgi:F-type H+-transporting ATPase subunit gamma
MVALERNLALAWSAPMVSHVDEAAGLANSVTQILYQRLAAGDVQKVTVIHAVPGAGASIEVLERQLLPFDYTRFAPVSPNLKTLVTLAPERLLGLLAEEYVNAQLCEAVILSFAAENQARMYAMIAARANVRSKLGELVDRSRRLRQEEITAEIIELSADRGSPAPHRKAPPAN